MQESDPGDDFDIIKILCNHGCYPNLSKDRCGGLRTRYSTTVLHNSDIVDQDGGPV